MSTMMQKTGRFANYTLQSKLLITFLALALIPLVVQTYLTATVARGYLIDVTHQAISTETPSANPDKLAKLVNKQTFTIWFNGSIIAAVTIGVSVIVAKQFGSPFSRLLAKIQQQTGGAYAVEISPVGHYEVDQLASAFNSLTRQLHHLTETSEHRIVERTHALEAVVRTLRRTTEITHQINTILQLDDLLQYIVDSICKAFDLYHVHIYLVEDETHALVMARGSGEVGKQLKAREHRLEMGQGIVGTVAKTNQYFLSNNVDETPNFFRNPLLPDTRAELAVPLRKGIEVVGVLDIQSREVNRFEPQDLALIQSLANQTAVAVDNARLFKQITEANIEIRSLNERLKEENLRMEAELNVTRKLQQMLLPTTEELRQVEGLDISGFMEPAEEVGGDYYDVLPHNGGIKIGIGDVAGHGLESGVLMLMLQTAVRTLLTTNENDPVRFMDVLNRTLYHNLQRMAVDKSLTLSLLDYEQGKMRVSGQHEQLMVVRHNGEVDLKDTIELGFPLGLESEISHFIDEMSIHLHSGDGIVLYSDGITEAENERGEFYNVERLSGVVSQHWATASAEEIQKAVIDDVRQFVGQQKVYDDLTLLVVKQL